MIPPDVVPISIAYKAPSWYKGAVYKALAPTKQLVQEYYFDETLSDFVFKQKYENKIYTTQDIYATIEKLTKIAKGKEFCLLVYEVPEKFSCRRSIIKWFEYNDLKIHSVNYHA